MVASATMMGVVRIPQQTPPEEDRRYRTVTDPQAYLIQRAHSQTDFVPLTSSSSPSEISSNSTEDLYRPKTSPKCETHQVSRNLSSSFNGWSGSRQLLRSLSEKAAPKDRPAARPHEGVSLPRRSMSAVPSIKPPVFATLIRNRSENGHSFLSNSFNFSEDAISRTESRSRNFFSLPRGPKKLPPSPTPSNYDRPTWISPESCVWENLSMREQVRLASACVGSLSVKEYGALQKISLSKLSAMHLGFSVSLPKDGKKSKRFGKKVRSNTVGFGNLLEHFKDSSRKDKGASGEENCWVFGFTLEQVLFNDSLLFNRRIASTNSTSSGDGDSPDYVTLLPGTTDVASEPSPADTDSEDAAVSEKVLSEDERPFAPHQLRIPYIVTVCISYLEAFGLQVVGIFRVAGSKKRVRQLREEFNSGKAIELGSYLTCHDVASLLKTYFRELPQPLLTRHLYSAFIETAKIPEAGKRLLILKHLLTLLPMPNRDTLFILLRFLRKVSQYCSDSRSPSGNLIQGNKMDARNLATVFGPNILHNARGCLADEFAVDRPDKANKTGDIITIVKDMILNVDTLFEISAEEQDGILCALSESNMSDTAKVLAFRLKTPPVVTLRVPVRAAPPASSGSEMSLSMDSASLSRSQSSPFFANQKVDEMSSSSLSCQDPITSQDDGVDDYGDDDYGNYVTLKEPGLPPKEEIARAKSAFFLPSADSSAQNSPGSSTHATPRTVEGLPSRTVEGLPPRTVEVPPPRTGAEGTGPTPVTARLVVDTTPHCYAPIVGTEPTMPPAFRKPDSSRFIHARRGSTDLLKNRDRMTLNVEQGQGQIPGETLKPWPPSPLSPRSVTFSSNPQLDKSDVSSRFLATSNNLPSRPMTSTSRARPLALHQPRVPLRAPPNPPTEDTSQGGGSSHTESGSAHLVNRTSAHHNVQRGSTHHIERGPTYGLGRGLSAGQRSKSVSGLAVSGLAPPLSAAPQRSDKKQRQETLV